MMDQYADTKENRQRFQRMADAFTWSRGRIYCVIKCRDGGLLEISYKPKINLVKEEIIYESDVLAK